MRYWFWARYTAYKINGMFSKVYRKESVFSKPNQKSNVGLRVRRFSSLAYTSAENMN